VKKFVLLTLLVLTAMTVFANGGQETQPANGAAAGAGASAGTAADLVRALGGVSKARANGDTVTLTGDVTLTGNVWIEKNLTISAGITLDLTADGVRLFLKDGASLTVNGTVNARGHGNGVDGGLCIDNGAATINGSGTINLSGKGRLLNIWGGDGKIRKLTLDGATLAGVKDNNASLVEVSEGGELVLKSGAITGNTRIGSDWDSGGGVKIWDGTFIMEGGTITGNIVQGGNGVRGGGVAVGGAGGSFIMKGGTISGNTSNGGERGARGGGVAVGDGGSIFTMEGGTISGNTVQGRAWAAGGGVGIIEGGSFTMKGGTISGNTANSEQEGGKGGGVSVAHGNPNNPIYSTFTMEGGVIFGNTARYGGGIFFDGATFTMEGGRVQGNTDSDGFTKNTGSNQSSAALHLDNWSDRINTAAKWGTGGTYTKNGISQNGGGDIVSAGFRSGNGTNDTLIAIPAR
jgi:hypothetical protein